MSLIQVECQPRDALLAAQTEIALLRWALESRDRAARDTALTPAEIHLRAFDQARAARGMAAGYTLVGSTARADDWLRIAQDFETVAQRLAPL